MTGAFGGLTLAVVVAALTASAIWAGAVTSHWALAKTRETWRDWKSARDETYVRPARVISRPRHSTNLQALTVLTGSAAGLGVLYAWDGRWLSAASFGYLTFSSARGLRGEIRGLRTGDVSRHVAP